MRSSSRRRASRPPHPGRRRAAGRAGAFPAAALLAAALLAAAAPPAAARDLPDPVYLVSIDARLDDDGVIRGREALRWHNTSGAPVPDLRFHLYLNAFANDRSTFMVESGGQLRGDTFDEKRWGYDEVRSMALAGGGDLKAVEEFIAPDDGNPEDRTVARYPLPEPVPPGGWVRVDVEFESRLPDIFARTGIHHDFVLAGQWFPKIAVWEDAGMRGRREAGWNAHQFHATSEFYADFGDYDVTLTLPERYRGRIGATGREVELSAVSAGEEAPAGTVTVRFVQDGVHDFAWTADPRSLVLRERFVPERDVPAEQRRRWAATLGLGEDELALDPVEITLLLRPENRRLARRYFDSAKAAIRGYGLRLGVYPWPTLTLVDPPWGGFGAGGMEYPTFITLGGHPLMTLPPFREALFPELVTVHEFGHQYFQGMIASNEFEEAWLDEGINSYYETAVMEDDYAPYSVRLPGWFAMSPFEFQHASIAGGGFSDPLAAPAWRYLTNGSYGQNSYPRPAVTLRHLENLLGPETFHRAMRAFFQRWQFRHPSTADFEATFSEAAGEDLGWFFRQALHSTRELDYSVRRVRTRRMREPVGYFWRDGERVERSKPEPGDGGGEEHAKRWKSTAEVFREGEFIHPVTVEFRFDDGRTLRREWSGERRWARWTFRGPAKLESAEVDPDGVLALDVDRLNNGKTVEPDRGPALAYATDILYWLASLFQAAALFA